MKFEWEQDAVSKFRQSLSQKIDEDVGKCENEVPVLVNGVPQIWYKCVDVPEEVKCEGCKRLLKFKRERLK